MMHEKPRNAGAIEGALLLDKLRVVRTIGQGGAGIVYEVEHVLTKHRRALKVLSPAALASPGAGTRFLREVSIAGRLRCPNIVETLDAGRLADGSPYVLMELLEGQSLGALLEDRGRLAPAEVVTFARQACEALAVAHAAGLVHRDIKPDNLFITNKATLKVLDFGVCKERAATSATVTSTGALVGTPYYMPPEQFESRVELDGRTDIYSLAVTMYEALAGARPYTETSLPLLAMSIYEGNHRPLHEAAPNLDEALAAVVEKAMHRDRDERYATAEELRSALAAAVPAAAVPAAAVPAAAVPAEAVQIAPSQLGIEIGSAPPPSTSRGKTIGALVAVLAVVVGVTVFLSKMERPAGIVAAPPPAAAPPATAMLVPDEVPAPVPVAATEKPPDDPRPPSSATPRGTRGARSTTPATKSSSTEIDGTIY